MGDMQEAVARICECVEGALRMKTERTRAICLCVSWCVTVISVAVFLTL